MRSRSPGLVVLLAIASATQAVAAQDGPGARAPLDDAARSDTIHVAPAPEPPEWGDANGSGIWISPGSDENEVVGNTFEGVVGAAVFLEGDRVKRRMTYGNSFVSIVEFAPDGPVARSIVAYGNSTDPDSPHYEDQAAMFARGSMKPVLFEIEGILANLEERYRPGERKP